MADIIAMFSRLMKSGLSALLDLPGRGRLSSSSDGSSSSSLSIEATQRSALDDIQRIMRLLPRIETVLEDAEEREIQDTSVKLWLLELRLLAYDIDDVIDEYDYDLLAAQMESRAAAKVSCHRGKRKRGNDEHHDEVEKREGRNILTSSSSQVPSISDGMAEKLREIRERFDEIERDRKALRLREEDGVRRTVSTQNPRPTSSLVDESSIIGRESEKEDIVKLLLSDLESDKITVIPIVGMGGIGKTTLAQLIYNDPRIDDHFDLRKWIYVSENFDLVKLTKEIYTSITNKPCEEGFGFDNLQDSIKKELTKFKRMFFVLDDVWNENRRLWESLKVPFHGAGTVNILLTTRNEKVGDVMRTMNFFRLGFLSKDEGLRLFKQCTSCDDKNLIKIGKKIVKKCGGLPLVIKLLGSHLRFERDEDKWISILESELWDLDPGSSEILPALRLSYERMPSHLKPCFRYCSIFPKDKMPNKNRLVWLWMAQGYIQSKISGKTMEEIGREYFDELVGRSFLQAEEFAYSFGSFLQEEEFAYPFGMHDLIFDLAVFISGNEFITLKSESGNQNICISNKELSKEELTIEDTCRIISDYGSMNLAYLQNLHIFGSNESDFSKIGWIPSNLHTLHLNSCQNMAFFPPYQNLSTLRLFKIWNCTALTCLPALDMLQSLEKLEIIDCPQFVLSPNNSFPSKLHFLLICNCPMLLCLHGLEQLFSLRDLKLFECSELMLPPPEQLPFMHYVQLELFNSPKLIDWCQRYGVPSNNKELPSDLFVRHGEQIKLWPEDEDQFFKNICILDYDGAILETKKWRTFRLVGFYILSCNHLKYISLWESFNRLKQLRIWDCSHLEDLDGLDRLTTLQDMDISNCPKLHHLYNIPKSLKYMVIVRCNNLWRVYFRESNLSSLEVYSCSNMKFIRGMEDLASLHFLKIENCPKLLLRMLPDMLNPNNVEISACPQLQEWCQEQDVAYYTEEG